MTAVLMEDVVTVREAHGRIWVEGFVTVGTSNAVRAGEPVILISRTVAVLIWYDQFDSRDQRPSVRFGHGWHGAGGDRS